MNQPSRWIGLGIVSALLVPTLLTHAFAPEERLRLGLTCAPFGWQIVMIVHLVASLPIGLVTSASLVQARRREGRWISDAAWALIGLTEISAVVLFGENVAAAFEWSNAGFLARDLARTVVVFLLVLPWLIVATRWDRFRPRIPVSRAAFLVAAMLALLPPLVYTSQLTEKRAIDLKAHLSTGRLLKAKSTLVGLRELGGRQTVGGIPLTQALRGLRATIDRTERNASRKLPTSASASLKLERAFLLIQLDRLEEAEPLLRSLGETMPEALLLLGAVYREQSRWADAERAYRQVLASSLAGAVRDRGLQERSTTAYEGWAEAARSGGQPEVAERAYLEAQRRLPAKAGYFAFQLGRHYLAGGRPSKAVEQLRQAARLDPTLEAQVRSLILEARVKTPACLLGSPYR